MSIGNIIMIVELVLIAVMIFLIMKQSKRIQARKDDVEKQNKVEKNQTLEDILKNPDKARR